MDMDDFPFEYPLDPPFSQRHSSSEDLTDLSASEDLDESSALGSDEEEEVEEDYDAYHLAAAAHDLPDLDDFGDSDGSISISDADTLAELYRDSSLPAPSVSDELDSDDQDSDGHDSDGSSLVSLDILPSPPAARQNPSRSASLRPSPQNNPPGLRPDRAPLHHPGNLERLRALQVRQRALQRTINVLAAAQNPEDDEEGRRGVNNRISRARRHLLDILAQPIDHLFEMEVERRPEGAREHRRLPPPRFPMVAPQPQHRQPQPQEPAVIDLTGEPDSPVDDHHQPPRPAAQNPRRQASQIRRTPSLARSDGSLLGAGAQPPVIDLTEESPPEARPAPNYRLHAARPPGHRANLHNHNRNEHRRTAPEEASILGRLTFARLHELAYNGFDRFHIPDLLGMLPGGGGGGGGGGGAAGGAGNQPVDFEVQIIGQNPRPRPMDNPLLNNPVQFNYQANGFGINHRGPSPKPPHVPPPAAREGFTRNTGEDMVAVCPSCDEELKYDPDEDEEGPPAKRARTRKDREEHHFWAVTGCGHVYCRNCFENRRNAGKKDKEQVRFRWSGKALLCAVDDCNTDVGQKKAWVGIFI